MRIFALYSGLIVGVQFLPLIHAEVAEYETKHKNKVSITYSNGIQKGNVLHLIGNEVSLSIDIKPNKNQEWFLMDGSTLKSGSITIKNDGDLGSADFSQAYLSEEESLGVSTVLYRDETLSFKPPIPLEGIYELRKYIGLWEDDAFLTQLQKWTNFSASAKQKTSYIIREGSIQKTYEVFSEKIAWSVSGIEIPVPAKLGPKLMAKISKHLKGYFEEAFKGLKKRKKYLEDRIDQLNRLYGGVGQYDRRKRFLQKLEEILPEFNQISSILNNTHCILELIDKLRVGITISASAELAPLKWNQNITIENQDDYKGTASQLKANIKLGVTFPNISELPIECRSSAGIFLKHVKLNIGISANAEYNGIGDEESIKYKGALGSVFANASFSFSWSGITIKPPAANIMLLPGMKHQFTTDFLPFVE